MKYFNLVLILVLALGFGFTTYQLKEQQRQAITDYHSTWIEINLLKDAMTRPNIHDSSVHVSVNIGL